jgi:hypothetical protein
MLHFEYDEITFNWSQRSLSQVATSVARKGPAFEALKKVETFQARTFFSSPRTERSAPVLADTEVTKLFSLWNNALATLDPDTVAKRYASKSVLLPTVSDVPRTDYSSIKSYFVDFLKKKPQGVILESNVIQGDDWCMDAGIYEFTMGATVSYVDPTFVVTAPSSVVQTIAYPV